MAAATGALSSKQWQLQRLLQQSGGASCSRVDATAYAAAQSHMHPHARTDRAALGHVDVLVDSSSSSSGGGSSCLEVPAAAAGIITQGIVTQEAPVAAAVCLLT